MKKVFIDAGHNYNGVDTGAWGYGYREQDISFSVSEKIKSYLEQQGILVQMSRNSLKENVSTVSVNDSLKKRANMANQFQADLFVSIHCNSGGGQGVETYCFSASSSAYRLAQIIQAALVQAVQRPDRGVKCANFLVLRDTKMPAVLIETGFIDSDKDIALLSDENGQYIIAQAIAKGLCEYLHIPFKDYGLPENLTITSISETDTVSADLLQVRADPFISSPVVGQFVKGDIVYSHARYGDWNKCLLWNGSYGWVERKYLTLKSNYNGDLNVAKVFVVTADLLNVRSLPSTDSPIIGALVKGDKVYTNIQKNGWYQIQIWDGSYGWICGKYLSENSADAK